MPERPGGIIVSAILAHSAWHWMTTRAADLRQFRVALPALDAATLAAVLRWLILLLIVVGVGWLLSGTLARLARPLARSAVDGRELGGSRGS